MAASSKFDFSSSSSDCPTHTSGQRGPHIAASLDRPGSFREAAENRIASSLPSTSRAGSVSSPGDVVCQLQSLVSDLKTTVFDQNLPRAGELRRSISSILGVSQEDSLPATFPSKPLPSSSFEEIRRLRNNLHEGSVRARERTKAFSEAVLKMDKCYNNLSRKRSRTDNSSSERSNLSVQGGSTPKVRPQSHPTASSLEIGPQKSEERVKGGAPSRKIRSSLLEVQMDARGSSNARPSGSVDRDRDALKLANNGATPPEEKGRALATAVDGWEKSKMKKKRSVIKSDASGNVVMARQQDGDREPKRGMQQKLIHEARPRLTNNHGFRSGSTIGITGVGKLDLASQPNGIGVRPSPRNNDQDNGSLPSDRRDRLVGADKEGATLKAASKSNGREDSYAASPTSMMKMNTSVRGPRSNSGSLSKSVSPSVNRTLGSSDDMEHPNCVNKLNGVAGAANRKRSASSRSSSPPVVQWGGQKHQKVTRVARRSNLTPVVSSRVDYLASEAMDAMAVNDEGLGFRRRTSSSASQQIKSRSDHGLSAGLSESEESGVVDNKSKDKSKKCSEIEEKPGVSIQKVATLVVASRRNKLAVEEDQEDGVRRNGKNGRVGTARSGMPASNEKLDSAVTSKQMRSARINLDKIESKPGRPPTKKSSERKGNTRPRHSANGVAPFEFAGDSEDDHEELLAAANAALNTSEACVGAFWEQNGEYFRFLSVEDQEFLNEQIRLVEEAAGNAYIVGDDHSLKDDNSFPSTPTLSSRDGYNGNLNGTKSLNECMRVTESASQTKLAEPFLEDLELGNGVQFGVSICQALLSAIIDDEEIETFNYKSNNEEDCLNGNAYGLHFEVDADLKSKTNLQSFGTFQAVDRAALYSYKPNTGWGYHDELVQEDLGSNGSMDELLPNSTITSSPTCTEFQYNQMSINDRVLLELSEIGLCPDPVPNLAQSDDEDIDEGINRLRTKLHEQALKKKRVLLELDKAVRKGRESQQRELECIALDKLIGLAYKKYVGHQGPNSSGSKNTNRTNKQAALAFVRRTLARCRQFEETGTSCFSEPEFKDMFSSIHSNKDLLTNAMNSQPLTTGPHPEIPLSDQSHALASQLAQREDIHNKYSDAFRSVNHLTEQTSGREDQWSNKLKQKELLLDEVVGSATGILRASSGLGGPLVSGTKGKRSERDREGKGQNRDSASRNSTAKSGRLPLSNVKGERKNKSKPKQKMTQLSASVNDLLGKEMETPNKISPSAPKSRDNLGGSAKKDEVGPPSYETEAIDLNNLQLPEIDVTDLGGQGQDIGSWLNIEEDGLQDLDFMGLEIPMDDLSEVNMMF